MIMGALTFQIGLASRIVSYSSIDSKGFPDRWPGVRFLAHVAPDGLLVVGGIAIGSPDAVHVAVEARGIIRASTWVFPTSRFLLPPKWWFSPAREKYASRVFVRHAATPVRRHSAARRRTPG